MTMPAITQLGQISGQQLGQAIFQYLPALPGEGPPFMPRVLAKAMFPRGFAPGMIAALPAELPVVQPPVQLIPPAGIPAQPPANEVIQSSTVATLNQVRPPAQPAARQPTQADRDREIRFRRNMHRRISPH